MERDNNYRQRLFEFLLPFYHSIPFGIRKYIFRLSNSFFLKRKKALALNQIFEVEIKRGKSFKLKNYGSEIEHEIYYNGVFRTWESDVGWLWLEICSLSNIIIDIGANKGIYSLTAKCIKPKALIIAFEPSNYIYNKLIQNVNLNRYDIICEKLAVSNKTGQQLFFDIPNENQTTASLSSEKMKDWEGYDGPISEYQINTIKLSDYIFQKELENIDLIKIDIEMHEPEAFEGMGMYLELYEPIVFFEMLSSNVAEHIQPFINLNIFSLFHLKKDHTVHKLNELKIAENSIINGEWNYVLIPKKKEKEIRRETNLYSKLVD